MENGRAGGADEAEGARVLASLLRWEASGGTWNLVSLHDGSAAVDLISCDGGEVMGRLVSADPGFVAHVNAGG